MDPTGKGVEVGIVPQKDPAICPVRLLQEWLAKGELKSGFSGHSLRAGFATSAAVAGKTLTNIMRQGRWKDHRVAQTYIRPATVFVDNATEGLGDDDGED